jgi:hypothetical protein
MISKIIIFREHLLIIIVSLDWSSLFLHLITVTAPFYYKRLEDQFNHNDVNS